VIGSEAGYTARTKCKWIRTAKATIHTIASVMIGRGPQGSPTTITRLWAREHRIGSRRHGCAEAAGRGAVQPKAVVIHLSPRRDDLS
jgi:hypothetical protein